LKQHSTTNAMTSFFQQSTSPSSVAIFQHYQCMEFTFHNSYVILEFVASTVIFWQSSLVRLFPPVVCSRAYVLFTLFMCVCIKWCLTHIVLCFFVLSVFVLCAQCFSFSGLSILDFPFGLSLIFYIILDLFLPWICMKYFSAVL
jgi:hypothetical protein